MPGRKKEKLDKHGHINPMNWNQEFQDILELSEKTTEASEIKYRRLAKLAVDFVETAKTYGKVIISEHFLPLAQKTIKPITHLGGIAGGEKYIVRGILFKLAEVCNPERRQRGRSHSPFECEVADRCCFCVCMCTLGLPIEQLPLPLRWGAGSQPRVRWQSCGSRLEGGHQLFGLFSDPYAWRQICGLSSDSGANGMLFCKSSSPTICDSKQKQKNLKNL